MRSKFVMRKEQMRSKFVSLKYESYSILLRASPGCSKLTTLLVNVLLNFQKLISQI